MTSFDAWLRRTEWWLNPTTWTSPGIAEERIASELAEAIGERFSGKEVEFEVRGTPVSLLLEEVAVEGTPATTPTVGSLVRGMLRPPERVGRVGRVRVAARDVHVADRLVQRITAWAERAVIELGIQPHLATGPIDVEARISREQALQWASGAFDGWTAALHDGGTLLLQQPGRHWSLIARPTFAGNKVTITLERVKVGRLDFRVPRRYAEERVFEVPPPAPSIEVVDVADDGDIVVRLRHPGLREPVHLDQIRKALVNELTRWVW